MLSGVLDKSAAMHPHFKRFFEHLSSSNPLSLLTPKEQWAIFAVLLSYGLLSESTLTKARLTHIEKSYRVLDQAISLAEVLESTIFAQGLPLPWEITRLSAHSELNVLLREFAFDLQLVLRSVGRRRSDFNPATSAGLLVLVSETVKRLTGGYNDEHVAELFQVLPVQMTTSDTCDLKDLSGDAIRKRRNRFMRDYPLEYWRLLRLVPGIIGRAGE